MINITYPSIHFAKCRDNNGACYRDSIEEYFEPQIANECPKSCAECDGLYQSCSLCIH
uniref:ShKT domain-containing protein n=1 Tax=Lepeophtheirus salmonis TaxID=72036 RepID=A0A0K2UQQ2_LEPSM